MLRNCWGGGPTCPGMRFALASITALTHAALCRSYHVKLRQLSYGTAPNGDLLRGMQCLLRAFAPELAGQTLEQVRDEAVVRVLYACTPETRPVTDLC